MSSERITDVRAVALSAAAAVGASAAWYGAFGKYLARFDEAYADNSSPPASVLPVELARSTTVAAAVAALADRTEVDGPVGRCGSG